MGTSNFHIGEADKAYVIEHDEEDDFFWQESQEYYGDWIKELLPSFDVDPDLTVDSELRSFPASSIGLYTVSLFYLNVEFELRIKVLIRSGYYEGSNLDYESEWYLNDNDGYGDELESIQDLNDDELKDLDIKKGIYTIHKDRLNDKLEDMSDKAFKEINEALAKITQPYNAVAQFSNGETLYEKG